MAQFKWLRPPWKRNDNVTTRAPVTAVPVTAEPDMTDAVTGAFVERNIGFSGNLKGYDYDQILRDKEGNIDKIYMLADYYVDKDPLIRGIIKEVYTPFSSSGGWKLECRSEVAKHEYMEYYLRIGLDQFMRAVFYQYYKYGNVFIYMMPDGHLVTMPVRRMRVGNVTVNGTPVMEFDAGGVVREMRASGLLSEKRFIQDDELSVRLGGYPKEVVDGIRNGSQWVQQNPNNSFLMQDIKEDWSRYAYPLITACLSALAKKELISTYEDSVLNLGMRGFVHATYGDPD